MYPESDQYLRLSDIIHRVALQERYECEMQKSSHKAAVSHQDWIAPSFEQWKRQL